MSASGPILVMAGGTGGHVFPAEALAGELLGRSSRVHLLTDGRVDAFAGSVDISQVVRIERQLSDFVRRQSHQDIEFVCLARKIYVGDESLIRMFFEGIDDRESCCQVS